MNAPLKTILYAVGAATVASIVCTVLLRVLWSEPEWKASGDGRTIFNTRTGEVRYTASGRSVTEVQDERDRETNDREQRLERERLADERKRELVRNQNSVLFHKVKRFVDANPEVKGVGYSNEWETVTLPFRTNKLLSRQQHERLLDFLGRVVKKEPYKSDPAFLQAIEDLKKWDMSYTYW